MNWRYEGKCIVFGYVAKWQTNKIASFFTTIISQHQVCMTRKSYNHLWWKNKRHIKRFFWYSAKQNFIVRGEQLVKPGNLPLTKICINFYILAEPQIIKYCPIKPYCCHSHPLINISYGKAFYVLLWTWYFKKKTMFIQ
jgi:hypothetical protein